MMSNFQVQRDSPSAKKNAYLLCLNRRYVIQFLIFRQWIWHFGANEVARMSFINAGGPKEALSSLIHSLLTALVRSNLPPRRS